MKRNTNIDYFEEEDYPKERVEMNALELSDLIENKIENRGRMTKQLKKELNELIDEYNSKWGKNYTRF